MIERQERPQQFGQPPAARPASVPPACGLGVREGHSPRLRQAAACAITRDNLGSEAR